MFYCCISSLGERRGEQILLYNILNVITVPVIVYLVGLVGDVVYAFIARSKARSNPLPGNLFL